MYDTDDDENTHSDCSISVASDESDWDKTEHNSSETRISSKIIRIERNTFVERSRRVHSRLHNSPKQIIVLDDEDSSRKQRNTGKRTATEPDVVIDIDKEYRTRKKIKNNCTPDVVIDLETGETLKPNSADESRKIIEVDDESSIDSIIFSCRRVVYKGSLGKP